MKKLFTLLALAALLISCEGPMGPPGEDTNRLVQAFTIESNDWVRFTDANGLNPYYMCEKQLPTLTEHVYENGNINGYMFAYYDQTEVQVPLPYTIPRENAAGEWWAEAYSFDFTPGSVAFYLDYSAFDEMPPPRQVFRIVLTW